MVTTPKVHFNNLVSIGLVSAAAINILGMASFLTTMFYFEYSMGVKDAVINVTYDQDGRDISSSTKLDDAKTTCETWRIFLWIFAGTVIVATAAKLILAFLVRGSLGKARTMAKRDQRARDAYEKRAAQGRTAEAFGSLKGLLYGILGIAILGVLIAAVTLVWAFAGNTVAVEYENADDPDPNCDKRNTLQARVFYVAVIVAWLVLAAGHLVELLLLAFTIPAAGKAVATARLENQYRANNPTPQLSVSSPLMDEESGAYYNAAMSSMAQAPNPNKPFHVESKIE